MSAIILHLENLYNASWPKSFSPEAFILPDEDLSPVTDSKQIRHIDDEQQLSMGKALVLENEDLKGTPFYDVYIQPIAGTLQLLNK